MEVNDLPPPMSIAATGPLRVELKLGSGECHSKGCREGEQHRNYTSVGFLLHIWLYCFLAEDVAYSFFFTPEEYPVLKMLREEIYVQVNLVDRSDPNIILNLEHCWATSTPNPHGFPQWDLLVNGYLGLLTA